jgi:hypothetical protein
LQSFWPFDSQRNEENQLRVILSFCRRDSDFSRYRVGDKAFAVSNDRRSLRSRKFWSTSAEDLQRQAAALRQWGVEHSKVAGNSLEMPRPKTGGRQAGTPNKRTATIEEKLAALDCDPIEAMARLATNENEPMTLRFASGAAHGFENDATGI